MADFDAGDANTGHGDATVFAHIDSLGTAIMNYSRAGTKQAVPQDVWGYEDFKNEGKELKELKELGLLKDQEFEKLRCCLLQRLLDANKKLGAAWREGDRRPHGTPDSAQFAKSAEYAELN